MTTKAGAGHFGPLIPFAKAFRRAGADVLIAAPRSAAPMVRAAQLPLWSFDDPPAGERDAIFASLGDMKAASAQRVVGDIFARIDARAAYPGILAACQVWRPDTVISEITEVAGPLAAEVIGAPSICVGITQQGRTEQVLPTVIPALAELRATFGLRPDPDGARSLNRPYFTLIPAALEDPRTPASVAALRFRENPSMSGDRRTPRWAAGDSPLVYVSFGSVAPTMDLFPGLYRAAAESLAELPVRVLMTIGREGDPADLGPLPANVHVERWVPQNDVMPHAAAIVCHGGSGTVTMGLAGGVPMVVLPLFADQSWNAERIATLGAGIALDGGVDDAPAIGAAVRRMLADPSYRATAREIATEVRALPPVDVAVGVVRDLLARHRMAA